MVKRLCATAASAGVLVLAGGLASAQDGQVLRGEAAFGGIKDDRPGVMRHFMAEDLPAPGASPSASLGADPIARPEGVVPTVPEGFTAELVDSGLRQPRTLTFAPNGDLFVANSAANEVLIYRFDGDSAEPSEHGVFAGQGLNRPYGVAFYPPGDDPAWVYIANADGLVRFAYSEGDMQASGAPETILSGVPSSGHWTRDVKFSPDGETMYYAVGSRSNVGEQMPRRPEGGVEAWANARAPGVSWGDEQGRAAVLAFDPDGTNGRYFATGVRNCSGMTIQPQTGALWCAVNERDGLGNNLPYDYVTSVKEGGFYGWPWFYIGDNADPRWSDTPRQDLAGEVTVPDVLIQPHSAPLNVTFHTGEGWGEDYAGDGFVTLRGSWNRDPRTGYKVVRLPVDDNGDATGAYEDFVTGFVTEEGRVWGRPVGVAVAPDGSLFVSEDAGGSIWRISRE